MRAIMIYETKTVAWKLQRFDQLWLFASNTASEHFQFHKDICPEAKTSILHLLSFNCDVFYLSF